MRARGLFLGKLNLNHLKVIEEIQAELQLLRRQEEDFENHNHGICSKSLLELTKDVSVPTEDCFPVGNSGKSFVSKSIFPDLNVMLCQTT